MKEYLMYEHTSQAKCTEIFGVSNIIIREISKLTINLKLVYE